MRRREPGRADGHQRQGLGTQHPRAAAARLLRRGHDQRHEPGAAEEGTDPLEAAVSGQRS